MYLMSSTWTFCIEIENVSLEDMEKGKFRGCSSLGCQGTSVEEAAEVAGVDVELLRGRL